MNSRPPTALPREEWEDIFALLISMIEPLGMTKRLDPERSVVTVTLSFTYPVDISNMQAFVEACPNTPRAEPDQDAAHLARELLRRYAERDAEMLDFMDEVEEEP